MKKTINFMLFLIVIAFAKSTSAQNNEIISGIYIQEVNALQLKKIDCIVPMQIINNPDGSVSYLCNGIYSLLPVTSPPVDNTDPFAPNGCGKGKTCGPKSEKTTASGGRMWECMNANNYTCSTKVVMSDSTIIIILKDSLN